MQAARTYGIFSISDIVTLICGYLKFRDLVNLLTVSRTFFHCASPHVWTKLSGPQPLMGLLSPVIPDGVSKQLESPGQLLDQQSLLRFDLYAPLVRKITVDPTEEATKLAWHFLLRRVPRRPLLPGLRRLALSAGSSSHHEPFEAVLCALALLCPSLVQLIESRDGDAWIEPPLASLLLQSLAQTAPDLERLRLRALSQKQIPHTKSSLFSSLAAFRSLRILHCSTAMIDSPIMLLLSTLPKLDSLQINAPADDSDSENDTFNISTYSSYLAE
ncbi:hypothetical protein FRC12_004097 [Ceratobasidium sp. 428]|nr:hypothetical protein FRC12_004097 [Ceratobasidium sp. 428]